MIRNFVFFRITTTVLLCMLWMGSYAQQLRYVSALSGLNLRTAPHHHSELIQKLEYGQDVVLLDTVLYGDPILDGWFSGKWSQVSVDDQIGYVFDAYLSPLPAVHLMYNPGQCYDLAYALDAYIEEAMVRKGDLDTLFHSQVDGNHRIKRGQQLSHGAYIIQRVNDSQYSVELILDNVRIVDAYQIVEGLVAKCPDMADMWDQAVYILDRQNNAVVEIRSDGVQINKTNANQIRIKARTAYQSDCCMADLEP